MKRRIPLCGHCQYERATLPNDLTEEGDLCADCYWEIDAEEKRKRRADPAWRYNRVYSFAVTCLGLSEEKAREMAAAAVEEANKRTQ